MSTAQRVQGALQQWLDALNAPANDEAMRAATAPEVHARRHGNDSQRGLVVEWFDGHEAMRTWFQRSPEGMVFSLAGPVEADPGQTPDTAAARAAGGPVRLPTDGVPLEEGSPQWRVRYRLVVGDFEGGGLWRFSLADDGRIAWLEHVPDELHERYRMPTLERFD